MFLPRTVCRSTSKYLFFPGIASRQPGLTIYKGKDYTDASPLEYYLQGRARKLIHPQTAGTLEKMLRLLAKEGEKSCAHNKLRRTELGQIMQDSLTIQPHTKTALRHQNVPGERGQVVPVPMPDRYVAEMIMDRIAAAGFPDDTAPHENSPPPPETYGT